MTVSCGVATFPGDAKNPTELLAAADAALYAAKERGKDRAASYSAAVRRRPRRPAHRSGRRQASSSRSTQIRLLGGAGRQAQPAERRLADRRDDRRRAAHDDRLPQRPRVPAGRRRANARADRLRRRCCRSTRARPSTRCAATMGEGITGTAAQRGQTLNIGDAQHCEFAEDIEGSADIDESILAVPLRYERRTIGVIVLSQARPRPVLDAVGAAARAAGRAGRGRASRTPGCWRRSGARRRSPRRCWRSPPSRPPNPRCPRSPRTSPARLVT